MHYSSIKASSRSICYLPDACFLDGSAPLPALCLTAETTLCTFHADVQIADAQKKKYRPYAPYLKNLFMLLNVTNFNTQNTHPVQPVAIYSIKKKMEIFYLCTYHLSSVIIYIYTIKYYFD